MNSLKVITDALAIAVDLAIEYKNNVTENYAGWKPEKHADAQADIDAIRAALAVVGEIGASQLFIPEGYKLVPVEPTESMIVQGFESWPDEGFSSSEVWEEYSAMSGCQQAAHRAKLCYAAMIAAAPAPTTEGEKN